MKYFKAITKLIRTSVQYINEINEKVLLANFLSLQKFMLPTLVCYKPTLQ
jgi:hypothetical protein